MSTPSKHLIAKITASTAASFPSFGGGREDSSWGNPLVAMLKDKPAQFAAGVDIASVVSYILKEQAKARRRWLRKNRGDKTTIYKCGAGCFYNP